MSRHQATDPESTSPSPAGDVIAGGDEPNRSRPRRFLVAWLMLTVVILGILVAVGYGWNARRIVNKRLAELEKERAREAAVSPSTDGPEHPIDLAIDFARENLARFRTRAMDYTATMLKQELINEELFPRTTMFARVRNPRKQEDGTRIPLSVYLRYDDPPGQKGREVIWVEGENDGKIVAHEAGLLGFSRLAIKPDGILAMTGNRYPITEMGIERLLAKMVVRAEHDRQFDNCQVQLSRDVPVGQLKVVRVVIIHPQRSENHYFFRAEIELEPTEFSYLRYAAYDWPPEAGQPAPLLEEYIYQDVKLNPGLADSAFDPDNPEYNYP